MSSNRLIQLDRLITNIVNLSFCLLLEKTISIFVAQNEIDRIK